VYDELRMLPLREVLAWLGIQDNWKPRKGGQEFGGACPVHRPATNHGCFSYDNQGRYHCFSCGAKGRGAIDLVKDVRRCSFQEAINWLREQKPAPAPANPTPQPSVPEKTSNEPYKASYEKFYIKSDWLEKRGLNQDTLKHFGVGEY